MSRSNGQAIFLYIKYSTYLADPGFIATDPAFMVTNPGSPVTLFFIVREPRNLNFYS